MELNEEQLDLLKKINESEGLYRVHGREISIAFQLHTMKLVWYISGNFDGPSYARTTFAGLKYTSRL